MKSLKNVLLINAVSSGMTGLLLVLMPGVIAGIFEVPQSMPFLATGLFLVAFSLFVGYAAVKKGLDALLVKTIIALDCLWVVASILLLLSQQVQMSQWGYLLIGGVAAWVALMAYLQQAGLRKLLTHNRG